jgi:hypothetical protein
MRAPGSSSAKSKVWPPGPQAMSSTSGADGRGCARASARSSEARSPGPSRGSPLWSAKKAARCAGSVQSMPPMASAEVGLGKASDYRVGTGVSPR